MDAPQSSGGAPSEVAGPDDPIAAQLAMLTNVMYSNLINNTNLAQQNALAGQQAVSQVKVAVMGKLVQLMTTLNPAAAAAFTASGFAQQLSNLGPTGGAPASDGGVTPA